MIEIRLKEEGSGTWAPMIICDVCHFPIDLRNAQGGGNAIWTLDERTREEKLHGKPWPQQAVLHVHKGRCDKRGTTRIPKPTGWEDIRLHLAYLWHNAGYTPDQLEQALEEGAYTR